MPTARAIYWENDLQKGKVHLASESCSLVVEWAEKMCVGSVIGSISCDQDRARIMLIKDWQNSSFFRLVGLGQLEV